MENSTLFNASSGNLFAIFPNATTFQNASNHTNISSTSATTTNQPTAFYRSQSTIIAQVTLLAILGVVILLGNLASIVTFLNTQSLRRRSHYLIISLSFADFLVGMNDFIGLYFFLIGPQFNKYLIAIEFVDTFTGLASILTLSVISLERFYAIYFPFRHRAMRFKSYVAFIGFPWIMGTAASLLWLVAAFTANKTANVIYSNKLLIVILLALVTILASYISIGLKIRQNNPSAQNRNWSLRERKLVVTLFIVTLASLMTWLPLQYFLFVLTMCKTCPLPDFNVLYIMKFMQYLNSGINVFIYIVRMPDFRLAVVALICSKGRTNNPQHENTQSATDIPSPAETKSVQVANNQQKSYSLITSVLTPYGNGNQGFQSITKSEAKTDRNISVVHDNLADAKYERKRIGTHSNMGFEGSTELAEGQGDRTTNNCFFIDTKL